MSAATTCSHVFLGRPLVCLPSTAIERHHFTQLSSFILSTCPYHLRRLCCMSSLINLTPNFCNKSADGILSLSFNLPSILAFSYLYGVFSLYPPPSMARFHCHITSQTLHMLRIKYLFFSRERTHDVRMGRRSRNFFHAHLVQHTELASAPTPAFSMSLR